MEPVIKYEYYDDQYEKDPIQVDNTIKRSYNELQDENEEIHQSSSLDTPTQTNTLNLSPSTFTQNNTKPMHRTTVKNQKCNSDRTATKKSRKEKNILFSPPFYQLLDDIDAMSNKDGLSVRCCTCGSVVRGSKNVSSNFIKHLRRSHPTVKKMYDTYKIHRIGGSMLKSFIGPDDYNVSSRHSNTVLESEPSFVQMSETRDEDFNSNISEGEVEAETETIHNSSENGEANENFKCIVSQSELALPSTDNTNDATNLSNKTIHAINQMIDDKLNNFVSKMEFKKYVDRAPPPQQQNEIKDDSFTMNLNKETTLYRELNEKVERLQNECQYLRSAMQQTQTSKWQLQNEINALERSLNQRKLIIKNLQIVDPLQPEKSIENFIEEKLGLRDITLLNVTLLPSIKIGSGDTQNKENILIELKHIRDVKRIFERTHRLKHSGVYIERELSQFQRKRKEKLLVLRKELLRRKSNIAITLRNSELIIEGQTFYWDDVRGLCHLATNQVDTTSVNAVDYLKTLTELDLEEFINVLKNYNVQIR